MLLVIIQEIPCLGIEKDVIKKTSYHITIYSTISYNSYNEHRTSVAFTGVIIVSHAYGNLVLFMCLAMSRH